MSMIFRSDGIQSASHDWHRFSLPRPEISKSVIVTVEKISVAKTYAIDLMRLWPEGAVGVLPQGPPLPVRRYDRSRSILREPKPAIPQNWIDRAPKQRLHIVAGIEPWPSSRLFLDMRHEGT